MSELTKTVLTEFIEERLKNTDCFLVEVEITKTDVVVAIDSDTRVDIDFVTELNREIEAEFAPDIDNFNLEVGSVGLTTPFSMPRQYQKNIGNEVEVFTKDGKKHSGVLKHADNDGFSISVEQKVKKDGKKRPEIETVEMKFPYSEAKKVTYKLKFD